MRNLSTQSADVHVSNEQFLRDVFGNRWADAHVTAFDGDPAKADRGAWAGGKARRRLATLERRDLNQYMTVSLFADDPDTGANARKRAAFVSMHVVLFDDVGTPGAGNTAKVDQALVLGVMGPPSYRLETSPGNEQWGYLLDMPMLDEGQATALIKGMIAKGLTADGKDPGQGGVTRYCRMPVGTNGKPIHNGWRCRLRWRAPTLRPTGHEVAAKWGIVLPPPGQGARPGAVMPVDPATAAEDTVYAALGELGWLRGATGSGWGFVCQCPCVLEHSDEADDSGTAYTPGRGRERGNWKCHHGHCDGRSWESFAAATDAALRAAGLPSLAARDFDDVDEAVAAAAWRGGAALVGPGEAFLDEYVFIDPDNAFWSLRSRVLSPRPSLNSVWTERLSGHLQWTDAKGKLHQTTPDHWFFTQRGRVAHGLTYWPGEGELLEHNGRRLVNQYRRPVLDKLDRRITHADIVPWLELVRAVIGAEGRRAVVRFLDWLAGIVAEPGLKPGWMVVLHGAQGLGKDLLLRPVETAVGEDNVAQIKGAQLISEFNGWATSRLVLISELKQTTTGTATGHDQYNAIKTAVDNTRRMIGVNPKYGRQYNARNVCAVFTSTNETGALAMEPDDRRAFVVMSEAPALSADAIQAMLDWYAAGNEAHVVEWLEQRWAGLSVKRRAAVSGRAPWTKGKGVMIVAAAGSVTSWVKNEIGQDVSEDWPDIMTAEQVMANVQRAAESGRVGLPKGTKVPSMDAMGRLLAGLGCTRLAAGEQVRVKRGGGVVRKERLWAVRNHDALASLGGAALAKLVEGGQSASFEGSAVLRLPKPSEAAETSEKPKT